MLLYGLGGCVWSRGGWCGEWDWCMSSPTLLLGPLPRSSSIPISWKTDLTQGLSGRMANPPYSQRSYDILLPQRDERRTRVDAENSGMIIASSPNSSSLSLCFHPQSVYRYSSSLSFSISGKETIQPPPLCSLRKIVWFQHPLQSALTTWTADQSANANAPLSSPSCLNGLLAQLGIRDRKTSGKLQSRREDGGVDHLKKEEKKTSCQEEERWKWDKWWGIEIKRGRKKD